MYIINAYYFIVLTTFSPEPLKYMVPTPRPNYPVSVTTCPMDPDFRELSVGRERANKYFFFA